MYFPLLGNYAHRNEGRVDKDVLLKILDMVASRLLAGRGRVQYPSTGHYRCGVGLPKVSVLRHIIILSA